MGIGGMLLSSIWQLMAFQGQQREANTLSSQAYAVAQAGQAYISANSTTLLALTQLNAINNVARIKITASDTGDTATSVQGAGYLPSSFVTTNSYGQGYALYVQRQDGGAAGVDSSDRLIGLVITTGGATIGDELGARTANSIGAAGGFIRSGGNTASGVAGGWSIDFSSATGWSTTPGTGGATAGHLAVLTAILPAGSGGGGGGASSIDGLSDAATDYGNANMFLGQNSGSAISSGTFNTALGTDALKNVSSAGSNTAFGANALKAQTTGGGENSAFGSSALLANTTGKQNTAMGSFALPANVTSDYNTAIGAYSLYSYNTGSGYNTAVGRRALYGSTGGNNTAVGTNALSAVSGGVNGTAVGSGALAAATGSNNTAIGAGAGSNITSGGTNIIIGANVNAPSATAFNQLDIGDTIYGDLSTDSINIGSSTMVTGIKFDVTDTSASRLSTGTTAQRPTCTASLEGAQRWNSQTQNIEICGGGQWMIPTPAWTSSSGTPPTPNSGSGYFVLTQTTWDGNLGGLSGANSKCLTELTTITSWMGYATALAAGQLTAAKVKAFLCDSSVCGGTLPSTTYYFAKVGDATAGGANFSTDSSGYGPNNNYNWASPNYFNGTEYYFTGNSYSDNSGLQKFFGRSPYSGFNCTNWSSNSSGVTGVYGYSNSTGNSRYLYTQNCNTIGKLICVVNP